MKNKKELDVVFLLDKSGSMYGSEKDTIGGYNSYLEQQKNNKTKTYITTILFDNNYEELIYRKDIKEVNKITEKEYYTGGSTALFDAIGKTISKLEHDTKDKVLFIITTDGLENSSVEYNKNKIKKMIKKHDNWEFIYLGANIDSYKEGTDLGINKSNICNYKKDKMGTSLMFDSLAKASKMLESDKEFSSSWKDELEDYIKNNQE